MQPSYRTYNQQPPQRSPHAAGPSRRGIGPMVSGSNPQYSLSSAQVQAQQQAHLQASDRAKMRSRKPTDKNIPDGVEDCIIGDGVRNYRELRDVERRLDAAMMRKRLDIQDALNRNVKRYRTLRVWVSNTVEDQPWQCDPLDMDAFDFSTNMDSTYKVKIEGKLLDESEDDLQSVESYDEDEINGATVDEDDADETEASKQQKKTYKLSHFFKAMTVEFDRSMAKDGADQSVEWKKPIVTPNSSNPPIAADFDQLEFKRGGDENINITINLTRDENPERFQLSPALAEILDANEATRAEAVMGIWEYIKAMGLQEDDEKRSFDCDSRLRAVLQRDKGYIPYLPEIVIQHMVSLPPLKLPYTIRVDEEFHKNPQPTIYDIRVTVDDPLQTALNSYIASPSYATGLRDISILNDHLSLLIQKIANSKSKHTFLESFCRNPTAFIAKWLASQKRDLEVIAGEATRGGGEDATGEVWRRGGKDGVWGSENVRESVNLLVGAKARS